MARARTERIVHPQHLVPRAIRGSRGNKVRANRRCRHRSNRRPSGSRRLSADSSPRNRKWSSTASCPSDGLPRYRAGYDASRRKARHARAPRHRRRRRARCDPVDAQAVGMGRVHRLGDDADRPGIEIGMPDDPGRGCRSVRMLGESAAPIGAGSRGSQGRRPAWRRSRAHARQHSRARGEARFSSLGAALAARTAN